MSVELAAALWNFCPSGATARGLRELAQGRSAPAEPHRLLSVSGVSFVFACEAEAQAESLPEAEAEGDAEDPAAFAFACAGASVSTVAFDSSTFASAFGARGGKLVAMSLCSAFFC